MDDIEALVPTETPGGTATLEARVPTAVMDRVAFLFDDDNVPSSIPSSMLTFDPAAEKQGLGAPLQSQENPRMMSPRPERTQSVDLEFYSKGAHKKLTRNNKVLSLGLKGAAKSVDLHSVAAYRGKSLRSPQTEDNVKISVSSAKTAEFALKSADFSSFASLDRENQSLLGKTYEQEEDIRSEPIPLRGGAHQLQSHVVSLLDASLRLEEGGYVSPDSPEQRAIGKQAEGSIEYRRLKLKGYTDGLIRHLLGPMNEYMECDRRRIVDKHHRGQKSRSQQEENEEEYSYSKTTGPSSKTSSPRNKNYLRPHFATGYDGQRSSISTDEDDDSSDYYDDSPQVYDRLLDYGQIYRQRREEKRIQRDITRDTPLVKTSFQNKQSIQLNRKNEKMSEDFLRRVSAFAKLKRQKMEDVREQIESEELRRCRPAENPNAKKLEAQKKNLIERTGEWVTKQINKKGEEELLKERDIEAATKYTFQPAVNASHAFSEPFSVRLEKYTATWEDWKGLPKKIRNQDFTGDEPGMRSRHQKCTSPELVGGKKEDPSAPSKTTKLKRRTTGARCQTVGVEVEKFRKLVDTVQKFGEKGSPTRKSELPGRARVRMCTPKRNLADDFGNAQRISLFPGKREMGKPVKEVAIEKFLRMVDSLRKRKTSGDQNQWAIEEENKWRKGKRTTTDATNWTTFESSSSSAGDRDKEKTRKRRERKTDAMNLTPGESSERIAEDTDKEKKRKKQERKTKETHLRSGDTSPRSPRGWDTDEEKKRKKQERKTEATNLKSGDTSPRSPRGWDTDEEKKRKKQEIKTKETNLRSGDTSPRSPRFQDTDKEKKPKEEERKTDVANLRDGASSERIAEEANEEKKPKEQERKTDARE